MREYRVVIKPSAKLGIAQGLVLGTFQIMCRDHHDFTDGTLLAPKQPEWPRHSLVDDGTLNMFESTHQLPIALLGT